MPKTKTTPTDILRSSWSLFHQHGFHDTSLQQLADAAGLGKAGILHHFGSKAGLMKAVIDYAITWYREKVLSVITLDDTLEVRLELLLRRHFDLCQLNGGSGCFFANTILEMGVEGRFTEQLLVFHEAWEAAVTTLFTERFPPEEARQRAYRLFADYQGSVVLFKLYQDPVHLERLVVRTLDSISPEQ